MPKQNHHFLKLSLQKMDVGECLEVGRTAISGSILTSILADLSNSNGHRFKLHKGPENYRIYKLHKDGVIVMGASENQLIIELL